MLCHMSVNLIWHNGLAYWFVLIDQVALQALAAAKKLEVLLTLTAYTQFFLEENGFGSWLTTQETALNIGHAENNNIL